MASHSRSTVVYVYLYAGIQIGKRLAVRLPASVIETLELKESDYIGISVVGQNQFRLRAIAAARKL